MDDVLYNEYFLLEDFESILDDSSIFDSVADQNYLEAIYTEASSGATSQNIFVRIIQFVLKGLKFLWQKIVQLGRWLRDKIFGKNKKSADQIAEEVLGGGGSSGSASAPPRAPKKATPKAAKADAQQSNAAENVVKVEIPSSDKSTVKIDNIVEVAFKDIRIAFDKDRMTIRPSDTTIATANFKRDPKYKNVPRGKESPHPLQIYYIIELIKNAKLQSSFILVIEALEGVVKMNNGAETETTQSDYKYLKNVSEMCHNFYVIFRGLEHNPNFGNRPVDVTLDDVGLIEQLLKRAVDVVSQFGADAVRPTELPSQVSQSANPNWKIRDTQDREYRQFLSSFRLIGSVVSVFSFGLNAITRSLASVYMIDARYIGAISDIETLSQFVEKMASYGIPTKYIMYNAHLICMNKLTGEGAQDSPIWGQSRCVFFPPKESASIVKVAYNPLGKMGNKNEAYITKLLRGTKEGHYLANIKQITKNGYVVSAERVDTSRPGSQAECDVIESMVNASPRLKDADIEITDIHQANIGYKKDGTPCIVDFGGVHHRYRSDE